MMDAAFKKPAPQNLAFYLARMGGSGGPAWSSGTPQAAMPTRPPAVGWAVPAGVNQHEYNPAVFQSSGNMELDTSFDGKDAAGHYSPITVIVPNMGQ